MTRPPRILRKLWRECGGSTIVEFALLAPVLLTLLLGVIQIGIGMQEYNALRSVAGDVARYAVVNYQANNRISTADLTTYATQIAKASPYNLPAQGLQVTITTPETRVVGTTELSFTIRAQVNNIIEFVDFNDYYISYSRPIFLIN